MTLQADQLLGGRDPAQPLLTLLVPEGRVELSGSTVANWVAKTANLLVDGFGSPARVGLLLPLHWQLPCLLIGAATAGAEVVVGSAEGCELVFASADRAQEALDAGADDVLAVSTSPLGGRLSGLPPLVLDAGAELPGFGDRWPGPRSVLRLTAGEPVDALPDLGLGPADRVLTVADPMSRAGLLTGLLAPLAAGAAVVLCPSGTTGWAAEGITAAVGVDLDGTRRLDR